MPNYISSKIYQILQLDLKPNLQIQNILLPRKPFLQKE